MEVRILGPLQVAHGGGLVDLGRPQRRALVAALAIRANQVVSADRLVEDLWEGEPPANAPGSLRAHVSHVRRALASAGAGSPLGSRRPGYVLALRADELDAWRFERLAAEGRALLAAGEAGAAVATLRRALGLWRGPALVDFLDTSFAAPEARRLEEGRLTAAEDLVDARLAVGDDQALVGELRQVVGEHPLRERTWGQLIMALSRAGRQAEALRAFSDLRRTLVEELGIEPSPALQRLEAEVLRQEPAIAWRGPPIGAGLPRHGVPAVGGLPSTISSFVGRSREQAAVRSLLDQARLVTLTGPGGCGKTRLALEVATAAAAAPEGRPTAFVELGPVADAQLVPAAVAGALGVPEDPARPLVGSLQSAIGSEPILLLLDNCEHLLEGCAHLAEQLLQRCPGLRLLVTSRTKLGITGEQVWPVPPLALPEGQGRAGKDGWWDSEAVRLFAERAAAVDPAFSVSSGNAPAVITVCRRLDGLPLAIELAAARMAVLSIDEMVARLSEPFTLLSMGSAVAPPRQQTLRAAVDWSYRSLADSEQVLFARLSVFRGGFGLDAVEAVAGLPGAVAVLDGVTALVEKSLVVRLADRVGKARFSLLDTLRAYAMEELEEQAAVDATARRHAHWCLDVASRAAGQLRGPSQNQSLAFLDMEEGNLRAALDWALAAGQAEVAFGLTSASWWYWFRRGRMREGRERLARLLAIRTLDGQPRAEALAVAAYLAWAASDVDQAASLSREALLPAGHLETPPPPLALSVAGLVARAAGDPDGAARSFEQALDAFRTGHDGWGEAWVLRHLASAAFHRGDLDQAAALAEESRARFLELGDDWGIAGSTDALASIARQRGILDRARSLGEESIERHRAIGQCVGLAIALHHQAELLADLGDLAAAADLARESIELDRQHGNDEDMAATSALLVEIEDRQTTSIR